MKNEPTSISTVPASTARGTAPGASESAMARRQAGSSPAAALPEKRGISPRYVVCVGLLLASALTMQAAARWFEAHFRKAPVELLKPLYAIDLKRLAPDYLPHPEPAPTLSEDTIQTLGTREFVHLRLVDTRLPRSDPASVADVFISYFTGKPDMIPHRPEECIVASGAILSESATLSLGLAGVKAPQDRVPLRSLTFEIPQRGLQFEVLYLFHVNGRFRTTRDEVRFAQANIFDRYAYYMKVELRFYSYDQTRAANRAQSAPAAERLLGRLLPLLFSEHIPDWEVLNRGSASQPAAPEGA